MSAEERAIDAAREQSVDTLAARAGVRVPRTLMPGENPLAVFAPSIEQMDAMRIAGMSSDSCSCLQLTTLDTGPDTDGPEQWEQDPFCVVHTDHVWVRAALDVAHELYAAAIAQLATANEALIKAVDMLERRDQVNAVEAIAGWPVSTMPRPDIVQDVVDALPVALRKVDAPVGSLHCDRCDGHSLCVEAIGSSTLVPCPDCVDTPGLRPCSCTTGEGGAGWVVDEGWSPEFYAMGDPRTPHEGLVPCGFCNHGGWDHPWKGDS